MELFIQVAIVITGVWGQILVANKNASGFKVWIVNNILLIGVSVANGLYGMVVLYLFFSGMCFYSMWNWKRLDELAAAPAGNLPAGRVAEGRVGKVLF